MNNKTALYELVSQATWSLEEGAHLVNERNPISDPEELSGTSNDLVCRTYTWLKKELEKGNLHPHPDFPDPPRFSPGTLMRHLEENNRYVSKHIKDFYDAVNGNVERRKHIAQSKPAYIKAAKLTWKEHPNWSAGRVAKELEILPKSFGKNVLPTVSVDTIRKWLKGEGPNAGKKGRPKGSHKSKDENTTNPD